MDEMPNFDQPHETPADAPKKPRHKPMKQRGRPKKIVGAAMRMTAQKKRKKRQKVRVARKNAGFDKLDTSMSHKAFEVAWNILGMLSKFDAEAKIRILDKVKEVWT